MIRARGAVGDGVSLWCYAMRVHGCTRFARRTKTRRLVRQLPSLPRRPESRFPLLGERPTARRAALAAGIPACAGMTTAWREFVGCSDCGGRRSFSAVAVVPPVRCTRPPPNPTSVIPAKAGIQARSLRAASGHQGAENWMPAFAGMTGVYSSSRSCRVQPISRDSWRRLPVRTHRTRHSRLPPHVPRGFARCVATAARGSSGQG